ncbi:amidohydrolase family protein [Streptomyces sp. NPDC051987]|uniref:amidohydrolase family protein n=1 Tax=Streptomyces sp. NPDC051987 TaxID=3155808 RepID=UPI0034211514
MHADILFTGGTVRTALTGAPVHDALAVAGGRISALGTAALAARGPLTTVVDLAGGALLPAFGDSHVRPVTGGPALHGVPVRDRGNVEDVADALTAYSAGCAHQAFEEKKWGVLRPGMRADLVHLAADPVETAPAALAGLPVPGTWLAGRRTHEADASAHVPAGRR